MGRLTIGYGDELMAAGQAQRAHDADPQKRKVAICDRSGRTRWHELWEGNPIIATPREADRRNAPVIRVKNAVGCRPYLKELTVERGATYSDWRARDHVGKLYLTEDEQALGRQSRDDLSAYVVIEPGAKEGSCVNKRWGVERYQAVVDACPDVTWVQMVYEGSPTLEGVETVNVPTFRHACGLLQSATAYVGPEGGLHHACGVMKIPAVVIFGGFISPVTTGYPWHVNLADTGPESPCGQWRPCQHCQRALEQITPEQVVEGLRGILSRQVGGAA